MRRGTDIPQAEVKEKGARCPGNRVRAVSGPRPRWAPLCLFFAPVPCGCCPRPGREAERQVGAGGRQTEKERETARERDTEKERPRKRGRAALPGQGRRAAAIHFWLFHFRGFGQLQKRHPPTRAGGRAAPPCPLPAHCPLSMPTPRPTRILSSDRHLGRNAGAGEANHRYLPFLG